MKMVAASRLRRVQILVDKNQGYSQNLRHSALRVMTEIENEEKTKGIKYLRPLMLRSAQNPENYKLCVISSDRGLCVAYNSNIAKKATQRIRQLLKQGKTISVSCIGKKAYDILRRTFANTDVKIKLSGEKLKTLSYAEQAKYMVMEILRQFQDKEFDVWCDRVIEALENTKKSFNK